MAHIRHRREIEGVESPNPFLPRRAELAPGQPRLQPVPVKPLEYLPIPPTDFDDLDTARSDSYGHGHYKPGKVGPVYTFVKTDPYAHVKWGVRHVAGKKYAHGRR